MRHAVGRLVAAVTVSTLLAACSPGGSDSVSTPPSTPTSATAAPEAAPQAPKVGRGTTAQKSVPLTPEEQRAQVASLMVVGVTDYDDALAKLQEGAGGIFITSWANPELLTTPGRNIVALREAVGRPFSVSIDFEGGRVQRHSGILGPRYSPRHLAETMTPQQVEEHARHLGNSLRWHGVTVNFAPVLDVDTAALEVVGDRSFSRDPHVAGEYGAAFAQGLRAAGIVPVYKHFPGHGQASGDTHHELAVTPPLDQLKAHDLVPYTVALADVPAAVMVGHMVVPGLGDGQTPSTLEPAAYDLLRSGDYPGGVPFDGLIYTDDLSGMRAITDRHPLPLAVSLALGAGADQALFSNVTDFPAVIDAVVAAINTGQIPAGQIAESAQRVRLQQRESGF
ncbi:glycoside hydrolase family 3 N-terminal domain-containing protein [Corynebacterium suedekumii]|uniref:beta-N-acetylhexosaminidase n=1 Tax=Corynebacterium suedekumii TaxID=3049801 RepID=A0ABY8VMD3_9CORY|nr:glycoside hydrolase family 3 N-terminal domain-containing protein [Corynebacterium suedekumii]WIM70815.1 glycoside hydrolase family 3 N-terminal domain-containing protein [Corynebacterium suedekumii]